MSSDRAALGEPCLNPRLLGLTASATVASQERSNRLLAEGREIFKMGLGQSPFPVPDSVVEALQANAFQKDYLPVKGLGALRETLAARHTNLFGESCDPDHEPSLRSYQVRGAQCGRTRCTGSGAVAPRGRNTRPRPEPLVGKARPDHT